MRGDAVRFVAHLCRPSPPPPHGWLQEYYIMYDADPRYDQLLVRSTLLSLISRCHPRERRDTCMHSNAQLRGHCCPLLLCYQYPRMFFQKEPFLSSESTNFCAGFVASGWFVRFGTRTHFLTQSGIERFIDTPGENDVPVSAIFTDAMVRVLVVLLSIWCIRASKFHQHITA
jgi:hypothetical protein